MSTIFKFFAGIALAVVSSTAFAGRWVDNEWVEQIQRDCWTFAKEPGMPPHREHGTNCPNRGQTPTISSSGVQTSLSPSRQVGTQLLVRQGAKISLPPGYRTRECDGREQVTRDVKHAVVGAALGAIPGMISHDRRAREGGALIGALIGVANSEMTQCVIIEQVAQQHQGGHTTNAPSSCKLAGGRDVRGLSREECDKLAREQTRTHAEDHHPRQDGDRPQIQCPQDKRAEVLNWPGHPQDGKWVCIPNGEPNGPR